MTSHQVMISGMTDNAFASALADVRSRHDFSAFVTMLQGHGAHLLIGEFYERMATWLERSMVPGSSLPPPPEKPTWQWVGRLFYGAVFEVEG